MKKILAFTLTLVMLFTTVISLGVLNVSATLAGAGIPDANDIKFVEGCDLSIWNVGGSSNMDFSKVNFAKLKSDGCEFVILRMGLDPVASRRNLTLDKAFLEYYKLARAADMPLGIYFYSRALTKAEAIEDANWVISVIEENNMYFEYPLYYDVEEDDDSSEAASMQDNVDHTKLTQAQFTAICEGWCETMEANGYYPGVYSSGRCIDVNSGNKLTAAFRAKYDTWIASIGNGTEYLNNYKSATFYNQSGMWQYSFDGEALYPNGLPGATMLDVNVAYKDYPAIMYANGYNNCVAAEPNLVSGKTPLTSSGSALASVNTQYNASLTDGKAAAISAIDTAGSWFGIKEGVNSVGTNAEIIFDLGARYDITGASLHLGNLVDYGICSPYELKISVSDSIGSGYVDYGTNFTVKSSSDSANVKVDYWSELTNITGLTGRYVKISCILGSSWFMINEIKIHGNLNTTPVPVSNSLVSKKAYTISGNGTTVSPYTANLTDGVASDNVNTQADWFAFKNVENANTVNGEGTIVFDLGSAYNITGAKVHLGYNDAWGVTNPWGVYISVSNDGVNYSDAKEFPVVKANAGDAYACWTELSGLTNFAGRYVKIMVGVTGTWSFLNEIEVYGDAHSCVAGSWETAKEPTATEEGLKQQCCIGCGKVLATEVIPASGSSILLGDMNEDGKLTAVDYMMLKKYVLGSLDASNAGNPETLKARADVTGDGKVTATDYFKLKILILS